MKYIDKFVWFDDQVIILEDDTEVKFSKKKKENSLEKDENAGKGNPNRDPKSGKFSTGPDGPDSKLYSRNPTKAKIVRADKDEKPKLERAMRYLSTNELMPDIKISTAKLGTKYGNTSGKNIYIDSDTIKSQPATFVASILFHEGVHTKQDIKMPSMKRESEARFKTKMWAGFKAGSKDIDSDEKAGFLKAVKEQS